MSSRPSQTALAPLGRAHKAHCVYSRALWPPCLLTSLSLSLASLLTPAFWHRLVIGVLSRLPPFETVNLSRRHPTTAGAKNLGWTKSENSRAKALTRGRVGGGGGGGSLFRLQTVDGKFDSDFISCERQDQEGWKRGYFPPDEVSSPTVLSREGLKQGEKGAQPRFSWDNLTTCFVSNWASFSESPLQLGPISYERLLGIWRLLCPVLSHLPC